MTLQDQHADPRVGANRMAWNASAKHHGQGAEWDRLVAGFATPGFSVLDETITSVLSRTGLSGKRVVQVGCNNGRELLSCLALGAVSGFGIDQSEAFLEQADRLNALAGGSCHFLCTDIYQLPPASELPLSDVALITIGVLNWMPDLPTFFRQVARLLVPEGQLVIYETHPFLEVFDPTSPRPMEASVSYFRSEPIVLEEALVYDGAAAGAAPPSFWFVHPISHVLNSALAAGFELQHIEEYAHSNREAEYSIYEGQKAQLPMCYSLEARRR